MNPNNKIIQEKSYRVMISGQSLFYRVACGPCTKGTENSLLLLHGYGATGAIWKRTLPFLAQHYQVIIVDLPGHGRSQFTGTWRLREIAPLLVHWLQQMGLQSVVLAGHSMGGAIAIHLTASAPELIDRLILVNAAGLPLRAQLPTLAAHSIGSFLQPGNGSYPAEMLRNQFLTSPHLLWQCAQEMLKSDFRAELAMISAPTLIIWGERDLLLPLTLGYELHTTLPHATFTTMPECGHRPMLGQPAKLSQIMLRFLQEGYSVPP